MCLAGNQVVAFTLIESEKNMQIIKKYLFIGSKVFVCFTMNANDCIYATLAYISDLYEEDDVLILSEHIICHVIQLLLITDYILFPFNKGVHK